MPAAGGNHATSRRDVGRRPTTIMRLSDHPDDAAAIGLSPGKGPRGTIDRDRTVPSLQSISQRTIDHSLP